jgi:hypothetical protein
LVENGGVGEPSVEVIDGGRFADYQSAKADSDEEDKEEEEEEESEDEEFSEEEGSEGKKSPN